MKRSTRHKLLAYAKTHKVFRGSEISRHLGISRQAVHKQLKPLIKEGILEKIGSTRSARYSMARTEKGKSAIGKYRKIYFLAGLEEENVFQQFSRALNLRKTLSKKTYENIHYAFTEIVNNAIDHSHSKECLVEARLEQYSFVFRVRDFGVGIFKSISDKYELRTEADSVPELIKGKITTMEEEHTGEGIFFTSKIADYLSFRSHELLLIFDNAKSDIWVEETRSIRGTQVKFRISRQSKKVLDALFAEYAPERFDYKFEKTRVLVRLFKAEYVSRSEARRLLQGLDRFREIVLDFSRVRRLGHSFTDEIFRVFQKRHPEIELKCEKLSPNLAPMIRHVVDKEKN